MVDVDVRWRRSYSETEDWTLDAEVRLPFSCFWIVLCIMLSMLRK